MLLNNTFCPNFNKSIRPLKCSNEYDDGPLEYTNGFDV